MSLVSVHWDIDIVATSSIVHREDYNAIGSDTFALLRREKIVAPDGAMLQVPVISGGSFRGVLRRIGEQLTATVLNYEASLPIAAAHLLTNGGRLAKAAHPLTDEEERRLKALLPQIAVFGGAASARVMSGLLSVGKVLPEFAELVHLLPRPPHGTPSSAVRAVAEESFSHLDDRGAATGVPRSAEEQDKGTPLGHFSVETLPAGTRLQTWARLANATPVQATFFRDILNQFATNGHLGGRSAAGHGTVTAQLAMTTLRGEFAESDWAAELAQHRDDTLAALSRLG